MSVSSPFCTMSPHDAGRQALSTQRPLAHSADVLHSMHWPALGPVGSAQIFPPPVVHGVPPGSAVITGAPPTHSAVVQSSPSGTSVSSSIEVTPPLPSQMVFLQS